MKHKDKGLLTKNIEGGGGSGKIQVPEALAISSAKKVLSFEPRRAGECDKKKCLGGGGAGKRRGGARESKNSKK